jgi:capsular exopolysaccharide synthesis family protein
MLRTNLVQHPAQPHVLAISSATSGDGKSTTTINLGGTFALKSESNVLIIDADLRRCSVAASLGLEVGRGLTDVLRGECAVDDAIVRLDQMPNLHVLASRRSTTNPAELLDSPAWKNLIQDLRERFSYILIDTTPMQAVADFKLVQQVVDGVVMVVRPDHTSRPALERALTTADDKLLGLVVNAYEDWFLFDSSHNYGYYAS